MEEQPRDIQQVIAQLMATDPTEQQPEEVKLERLREDATNVIRRLQDEVNFVINYYKDLVAFHTDLRRREEALQALKEEEKTDFTEEEIGAGNCYFRVLKLSEKYANKPYKHIWTRYDNLRNTLKIVIILKDLQKVHATAAALLAEMENKVCKSPQEVISFTEHIKEQCAAIAEYQRNSRALVKLKSQATELLKNVKDEINQEK